MCKKATYKIKENDHTISVYEYDQDVVIHAYDEDISVSYSSLGKLCMVLLKVWCKHIFK